MAEAYYILTDAFTRAYINTHIVSKPTLSNSALGSKVWVYPMEKKLFFHIILSNHNMTLHASRTHSGFKASDQIAYKSYHVWLSNR